MITPERAQVLKDIINELHYEKGYFIKEYKNVLLELIDRATPKEVVITTDNEDDWVYCPSCNRQISNMAWVPNYCHNCGQALKVGE